MEINGHRIGPNEPVYLVVDCGSNHNGNLDTARALIRTAAECGADAIKFQFFKADTMVAKEHPDYTTFKRYEIPNHWLGTLKCCAQSSGITLFFSVFDPQDVKVLEEYDPPAYKIASAELTYDALLEAVAKTGKPVILSTGMATQREVTDLWYSRLCQNHDRVAFLHCVSSYPSPAEEMNLRSVFDDWREITPWTFGLSDHSADPFAAPLMATALGACLIEKHFTLDRNQQGPDHSFAIEPHELKQLATSLHQAHLMRGDGIKRVMPSEMAALSDRRTLQDGKWLRGFPNSKETK